MSTRRGFGIQEVTGLVQKSRRLQPVEAAANFELRQVISTEHLSPAGRQLLEAFKPIQDGVNWESAAEGADPKFSGKFATTKRLLAAHDCMNWLRRGRVALQAEATTAGVDLPTFVRQLLMTIQRAYAQLFTPELFGVIPLTMPYGRIHFRDYLYDNAFTGSTPTIAAGDRTDDITKFNKDFYNSPEGQAANRVRYTMKKLDVSTNDRRVLSEWSDSFADDAQSVYGDNAESVHMDHQAQEMARVVDREVLIAMINAVPAGNKYTWTQQPTSNPNYQTLSPSEQQKWDERLWNDGFVNTIEKIRITRKYANDSQSDWIITGSDGAIAIQKLTFFMPTEVDQRQKELASGALRDLGTLKGTALRILVDPMLGQAVTNGTKKFYFGRRPRQRGDVGIYWLPYINLQPTQPLYDPETGMTMRATRSRYGVAQPNTGTEAASSQLGEVYGELTMA